MQTIKIYLKESGSVAELVKDFNLYAGSYQNKLLNVYVPTGILYTATNIDNGVKVGGLLIAPNGSQITTKSYYLNFVRNETIFDEYTQKDIEYAVYERLLPKEFTLFSGEQKIVTNVVAIDNTGEIAVIKQIVTTQTATLVVQESAYIEEEEPIEADLSQELASRITQNESDIYALQERVATNETNIMSNTQEISKNAQEIETIKEQYTQPEDYVGQMVGTMLPTQEQLTQYVLDVEGRQPKNADVVIFILQIEGETDKNYKYIYSKDGWNGYEIPAMETAKNGELGLIEGTFNIGSANDTIVDIVGGQIVNIYVKDNSGAYRNVQEYANTLKTSVDDIVSGKTKVGNATKAEQDGLGNNIANTYLNKNEGATKNYVQDYALPKQFNDVSYITDNGYSESIPSVSFGATSSTVGSTQLFDITKTAGAKYQISNKNSYDNVVWIGVNRDCTVEFRLTTKIKGEVANVEVNDNISLTAGGVSRVTFHDTFDYLNEDVLKVEENDTIEQILEVITSTSEEITFTVYSNSIYPSKFYLNTQSMVVKVVEGTIGEQLILGADGVIEENVCNFTVDSADAYMPYRKNGTKFLVDLHLAIVGEIDNTKEVVITFGDTVYYVYNILKGAERVTIGDLRQITKYSNTTGYRFIVEMTFFENTDITGFAIIPTVSISDVLSLTSDEMDNYIAEGGLTQGQLAICKKVITNGYTEGGLYRFDITYPDTYAWTELSSGGGVSEEDFNKLVNNEVQINSASDKSYKAGGAMSVGNYGVGIGKGVLVSMRGTGVGEGAKVGTTEYGVAYGREAIANGDYSAQIGQGTNNTPNTIQIYKDNIYNHETHTLTVQNIELNGENLADKLENAGGTNIISVEDSTITTNKLEKVVHLSEEQYQELIANGSIIIGDQTLTYSDNAVYVTPDESAESGGSAKKYQHNIVIYSKTAISRDVITFSLINSDNTNYSSLSVTERSALLEAIYNAGFSSENNLVSATGKASNSIIYGVYVGETSTYINLMVIPLKSTSTLNDTAVTTTTEASNVTTIYTTWANAIVTDTVVEV